MLARMRQSAKTENDGGFTLIELLVVMIIIGILAAIAIPVFLSQRQKARDAAAKSDVSTIGKELATYFVDNTTAPTAIDTTTNSGRYTILAASGNNNIGKVSTGVSLVAYGATTAATSLTTTAMTPTAWCVAVKDTVGGAGTVYKYSAQNGLETGQCTSASTP